MLKLQESLSLTHKIYRADQVREHERVAAEASGCDMYSLMARAGAAVFNQCQLLIPNTENFLILVGQGNNAGDGYVAAMHAKNVGKNVYLCAVEPERVLTGDAGRAQQAYLDAGGKVEHFSKALLDKADIVIDALLGTGITTAIRNEFADIIDAVNEAEVPVVSIDVPSGLDANTGESKGRCIQADVTVTLVGIKPGLTTGAGKQSCGKLVYDDLGIGKAFMERARSHASLLSLSMFTGMGPRDVHSHKGDYGRLLCIGGNRGTPGAIRLSAEAAMRTGAGLVKVFAHEQSRIQVSAGCPELMVTNESLDEALAWCTTVVLGPGLGQDEWAKEIFERTMSYCEGAHKPMVLDADALNLLSHSSVSYNVSECLITPHAGEAARLLGVSVDEIESDRFNCARQLAQKYHATCVLKGAGSVVDTERHAYVCQHGNPGMATAGMGDVLTGILGALLAQGIDQDLACKYGVSLHAKAGDCVAEQFGERGMMASDLFHYIRMLINGKR
ncbi:NAD(P)H-hydrate dehydratase [Alteromonas sediminis]|uniref:Bifunctional NAD(P)H-hydrate repair enzyme n=1 Tax=Alteromonas sediminis TaxID=2259342 RepID=A0A3N5XXP8_9ALTE|nr:NAD(P)H-hydrate dehydratase [Alteromonas sediminis]RPJ65260.1 NAD(P)H-hydrate dehydratase [Alteromonas sediminis]